MLDSRIWELHENYRWIAQEFLKPTVQPIKLLR